MKHIEISLSGKNGFGSYALVDGDYDGELLLQYKWHLSKSGYACRKLSVKEGRGSGPVYLHREIMNPPKGLWVDHINRNKLDNRSNNLRLVTPQQSAANRLKKSSRLGYIGVRNPVHNNTKNGSGYFVSSNWVAYCRQKYIGVFETAEEAARAYDKEARKHFGEYGVYNFPE